MCGDADVHDVHDVQDVHDVHDAYEVHDVRDVFHLNEELFAPHALRCGNAET